MSEKNSPPAAREKRVELLSFFLRALACHPPPSSSSTPSPTYHLAGVFVCVCVSECLVKFCAGGPARFCGPVACRQLPVARCQSQVAFVSCRVVLSCCRAVSCRVRVSHRRAVSRSCACLIPLKQHSLKQQRL